MLFGLLNQAFRFACGVSGSSASSWQSQSQSQSQLQWRSRWVGGHRGDAVNQRRPPEIFSVMLNAPKDSGLVL